MKIVGHQKTSFIDYPDKICSVIFVEGCNFRCPYCHNGHIVDNKEKAIEIEEILAFLKKRKKYIDGVCISGGEPTLYEDLAIVINKIKEEEFLVKLDTNGSNPLLLRKLLDESMVDYVAMDIKAPLEKYESVVGSKVKLQAIIESVQLIKDSIIDHEFRTTVAKELLAREDIINISEWIKGGKRYYLQNFKDGDTVLGGKGKLSPYDEETLLKIAEEISSKFEICKLRK